MNAEPLNIAVLRDLARERLTNQVLDATNLEEIAAARIELKEWIRRYPAEEGMSDAFEQLSLLEDIALGEIEQAKNSLNDFNPKRHEMQERITI